MQYKTQIKLIDITKTGFILGSQAGDQVLNLLRNLVSNPINTVEISLENITGFDACFVRNSIATFAKLNNKQIGIIITNVGNIDVLENLMYGFNAKQMPLLIRNADGTGSVYGKLNSGSKEVLSFVYSRNETTTSEMSKRFNISAPNASAKLKKLHTEGYIHAEKQDALTGGIEYVFSPYFSCSKLNFCA